jgi:DNA-binding transcriptional regulator YiaG
MKNQPFQTIKQVKEYLSGDKIECLICGKSLKSLGNHLRKSHQYTPRQYKLKYNIPLAKYGLVSARTRQKFVKNALSISAEHLDKFKKGNQKAINKIRGSKLKKRDWTNLGRDISQANLSKAHEKLQRLRQKKETVFCRECQGELRYSAVDVKVLKTVGKLPICKKCEARRRQLQYKQKKAFLINGTYYYKGQTLNAAVIKKRLKELQVSQRKIAFEIGVNPETFYLWMKGKKALTKNVLKLSKLLSVNFEEIIQTQK